MKHIEFRPIHTTALVGLLALATATPSCNQRAQTEIYVAPNGSCASASGNANSPFRRIGDAIEHAKGIRMKNPALQDTIVVIVKPGTYVGTHDGQQALCNPNDSSLAKEKLPLIIDISNFELRGQTVLVEENKKPLANGVPRSLSFDGNLTMIRPAAPLEESQAIIYVRPPDGGQVTNVTINGFMLSSLAKKEDPKSGTGLGIFIDRASKFSVRRNLLAGFATGLRTRGSSGLINQNVAMNNITEAGSGTGFVVTGGSRNHPAEVQVLTNFATGNELGILLIGPGTYKTPTPPPTPKSEFDLNLPSDQAEVPDTLDAVVAGNVLESNALAGLRVFAAAQQKATYTTKFPLLQPISTKVHLECRNNSFIGNTYYGIAVDAGFPRKVDLYRYQFNFVGEFEKNTYANNGTARAFLGFQRLQAALGIIPEGDWKPLEDSVLDIRDPSGELGGFNFAHPFTLAHLNSLVVNGNVRGFGKCIGGNC